MVRLEPCELIGQDGDLPVCLDDLLQRCAVPVELLVQVVAVRVEQPPRVVVDHVGQQEIAGFVEAELQFEVDQLAVELRPDGLQDQENPVGQIHDLQEVRPSVGQRKVDQLQHRRLLCDGLVSPVELGATIEYHVRIVLGQWVTLPLLVTRLQVELDERRVESLPRIMSWIPLEVRTDAAPPRHDLVGDHGAAFCDELLSAPTMPEGRRYTAASQ